MPKHHYNPNFILRRFVDASGTLWVLDKQSGRCWPKKGGSGRYDVFAENDYNTVRDSQGAPDDSVEDYYTKIETRAAPIVDRVIDAVDFGFYPHITQIDREDLARLLWAQHVRSPFERAATRRDGTARRAMYRAILDTSVEKGIPPALIRGLLPKNLEQMMNDAIIKAPTAPEEPDGAVAQMRQMAVDLLNIPTTANAHFVTSDRPCLVKSIPQRGGDVLMPLTKNVAIQLSRPEDSSPTPIRIDHTTIHAINRSIFDAALRFVAGPSRKHLCDLLTDSGDVSQDKEQSCVG